MACHIALWGVVRATHGLPSHGPQCTVGVLAGTQWRDDSSRVMSHQSANPLWLCRVGGRVRDHGRELSRGLVMWTSSTPPRLVRSGCRAYRFSLNWCSRVSSTAPFAFMWMFVLVSLSFSGFVACLAIVQVLCGLTRHVLELHRLDEICVPLQNFLST